MFSVDGLKEQRKDLIEDITSIEIYGLENELLFTGDSSHFEVGDMSENPTVITMVIRGEDVGLEKVVDNFKILKGDTVLYASEFADKNKCVTLQDTFTFKFNIGN